MTVTLSQMAERVRGRVIGARGADPEITDLSATTTYLPTGVAFACVRGANVDGHDLAPDALEQGAVALVVEDELDLNAPQLVVEDVRAVLGPLADLVHGHPSGALDVIGVTGTNGKTTVVSMLAAIFAAANRSCATIGTLSGERTTPEAPDLQRQLARFRDEGVDVVAMEVSSHALDQGRVNSVDFDVAVFTNLGQDHLDYHLTPEAYFGAKARLFEPGVARRSVLNIDDIRGRLLRDAAEGPTTGVTAADASDIVAGPSGTSFTWQSVRIDMPMHGSHNVINALLAATAAHELGVPPDVIARGLQDLPVVPGRFETFELPNGAVAVVDYAHTPDALDSALRASRELAGERGKVTVVFGCGGDRDATKRPMMGAVAGDAADAVIITSDNPRSEDPEAIAAAVRDGVGTVEPVIELDRGAAIAMGLDAAGAGDVVLIAGKGHESGQTIGEVTHPFDDREKVRAWIADASVGAPDGDE